MINIIKSIKVNNEICLVTGSTGHLGKEFAKLLAEMGYSLILTDKKNKSTATEHELNAAHDVPKLN